MTVLELAVPQVGCYPTELRYCPNPRCGKRLRVLNRYLRINATEEGDARIEFADPAAGYKGKRARRFVVSREELKKRARRFVVSREELKKVGLKLRRQEKLSPTDCDLVMRLWLGGIEDLQTGWRWLRDSTTVWYQHPPTENSCSNKPYVRFSQMPRTFGKWVAPLFVAMYVCGYSYAEIAKQVGIDTKTRSKGRSTVAAAIKSLLKEKKISREKVSEAHKRNQTRSVYDIQKGPDKWGVRVSEGVHERDRVWLTVLGPDLGLAVRNQEWIRGQAPPHDIKLGGAPVY